MNQSGSKPFSCWLVDRTGRRKTAKCIANWVTAKHNLQVKRFGQLYWLMVSVNL